MLGSISSGALKQIHVIKEVIITLINRNGSHDVSVLYQNLHYISKSVITGEHCSNKILYKPISITEYFYIVKATHEMNFFQLMNI